MKDPVFARTRFKYDSYQDYWRLVELSGFQTCHVDEIDLETDDTYIISPVNGEFRPHVSHRMSVLSGEQQAKLVWWNLERPDSGDMRGRSLEQKIRDDHRDILQFVDAVWTSDRWVSEIDPPTIFVLMGSHPDLAGGPPGSPRFDLAHMSYASPRRRPLYDHLSYSYRIAPNSWGVDRDGVLRETRAMLNIHQTEAPISEPLRIALAAAYRLPYLTEYTRDPYPLSPGETCFMSSLHEIPDMIGNIWGQDLKPYGERLFERLCLSTDFRKSVMEGMEATESLLSER